MAESMNSVREQINEIQNDVTESKGDIKLVASNLEYLTEKIGDMMESLEKVITQSHIDNVRLAKLEVKLESIKIWQDNFWVRIGTVVGIISGITAYAVNYLSK